MSASNIGGDGIGRPLHHDHRWTKEYAPGYRHESEADDFRWVCDACTETHGMSWSPPVLEVCSVCEEVQIIEGPTEMQIQVLADLLWKERDDLDAGVTGHSKRLYRSAAKRILMALRGQEREDEMVDASECPIIGCNSPRQYGRWCGSHAPSSR